MMTLLLAAALVAQGMATSGGIANQGTPADEVRITRAIFGTEQGSADVTAVVTRLVQPGADEFYVAPKWLEADPAIGQSKSLVVFYEYRGEPRVLTTMELGGVSHRILTEHADPASRRRPTASDAGTGVVIIHAYYGQGRNFHDVTTRAGQIIRPEGDPVVISDSAMMVRSTANAVLIVTYTYRGARNTWSAWSGRRVSHEALVAYAESGGQAQLQSDAAPAWAQDAQAGSARGRGRGAGGGGGSPRREVGISELLQAIAELEAIPATERSARFTSAIAATRKALAEAQENIGYPYPPANSPRPEVRNASAAVHRSNAVRSLTAALEEFGAASPGRGRGAAASMARCIAAINEALAALR